MKKSTKGAIAAGAAGVLLLGGVGSLAYWTSEADVEGGAVTAGTLVLTKDACDADWVFDDDLPLANRLIVPGDSLTRECTYNLVATGDHLMGNLTISNPVQTGTNALETALDITNSTVTLDGVPADTTGANIEFEDRLTPYVIKVTYDVRFPFGAAGEYNDTKTLTATLADIALSVEQTPFTTH